LVRALEPSSAFGESFRIGIYSYDTVDVPVRVVCAEM